MRRVGNYTYGGCTIDGVRFAVIKTFERVECIRALRANGNPIIWQAGDPITDQIIRIMSEAIFTGSMR
jgi:hypothetical protein